MVAPKEIIRRATPHGRLVGFAVGAGCDAHALPDAERVIASLRAEHVRPSFVAGRLALRAALEAEGADAGHAILHDSRGAPVVPSGFVGSISHKLTVAVGVARRDDRARVGVDVELERRGRIDISARVLTDAELDEIRALDDDARAAFTLERFSMKEAVYKAIDPFLRRYVGFREVRLVRAGDLYDVEFVAPRADEPRLDVQARVEVLETEVGRLLASTAIARSP